MFSGYVKQSYAQKQTEPLFKIHDAGTEEIVDYARYGEFKNIGTSDYQYIINDWEGLSMAVGECIYPNNNSVFVSPYYKTLFKEKRLLGPRWSFTGDVDVLACYFKWAIEDQEDEGVKQFYIAQQLEKAGHIRRAVKAYYNIVVLFPKTIGWTYYLTPWPVGLKALEQLQVITRTHPELNLRLEGTDIVLENGFDNNTENDVFTINPGKLVAKAPEQKKVELGKPVKKLGGEIASVVQFENGYWQFQIQGKPSILKVIAYEPAPVG
ncbi:hypothetical protein KA005_81830, partial [bacterium]|nr:hypothetical protein [bacterium]